jgi:dTDP-4-amino-4,6-dideoxygalactose transaminase
MRCEENIVDWGYKYHMNDINAVVGLHNMNMANENISKAIANAKYYEEQLSDFNGIELTQMKDDRLSSYWLFTVLVEDRLSFANMMGSHGVAVSRVHERNDKHTVFNQYRKELPILESVIDKMICIPVGWWVTEEDREHIVEAIKGGW